MTEQELAHLEADLTMGVMVSPERIRALLDLYFFNDQNVIEEAREEGYNAGYEEGFEDGSASAGDE